MAVLKDKVELRADFPLAKSSCSRMARPLPGLLGEAQLRKYAHLTLMDRASLKLSAGKHTITLTLADNRDGTREITVQAGSEAHLVAKMEKPN